jgi:hypothetical protein
VRRSNVLVRRGRGCSGASADLQNAHAGSAVTPRAEGARARQLLRGRGAQASRGSAGPCIDSPSGVASRSRRSEPEPYLKRFSPAELSGRLPRLDGNMEASIHQGRRGGAISDG